MKSEQPILSRRTFLQKAGQIGAAAGLLATGGFPTLQRTQAQDKKSVTLRYWTFLNPKDPNPRSQAQNQILESFEAKYPHIKILVEIVPWQTTGLQLIQAAQAGKTPDVISMFNLYLAQQVAAKTILPLDEYIQGWSSEQQQDFIYPLEQVSFEGRRMAFFRDLRVRLLWYRKDWLGEAGFGAPRSWEELARAAQTVTTGRRTGFTMAMERSRDKGVQLGQFLISNLWAQGINILDDQGKANFNNEAGARIFQFLYDLVHTYKAMPLSVISVDSDTSLQMIKSGATAMITEGSHRVSTARAGQGVGMNLATTPIPSPEPDKPCPALTTGQVLMMGKDCKNREEAWLFIEHSISPEQQALIGKVAQEMPTRKSSYQDPWFQTPEAAEMLAWVEYVQKTSRPFIFPEKVEILFDTIAGAAQEVITRRKPIPQALEEAAARWNKEKGGS
jgi:multiple sugar transport system substrate-binding protein